MIIIRKKINMKNLYMKIQEIKENITVKYNNGQQYMLIHEKKRSARWLCYRIS